MRAKLKKREEDILETHLRHLDDRFEFTRELMSNYFARLQFLIENKLYPEYLILGSSLIEYIIEMLIITYDNGVNIILRSTQIKTRIYRLTFLDQRSSKNRTKVYTLGQLLGELKDYVGDSKVVNKINLFLGKRNDCTHNIADKYRGDFSLAERDLESYCKQRPVENLSQNLLDEIGIFHEEIIARLDEVLNNNEVK